MIDRSDRIVTSIFGRDPSWWQKITSPDDDYDPFGNSRKPSTKGIERRTADQEIAEREKKLRSINYSLKKYGAAQDHPGLTYDPELLPDSVRIMSGETYDRYVAAERQAGRLRYETEKAVLEKRSDLLVPLKQTQQVQQDTTGVATAQPSN